MSSVTQTEGRVGRMSLLAFREHLEGGESGENQYIEEA